MRDGRPVAGDVGLPKLANVHRVQHDVRIPSWRDRYGDPGPKARKEVTDVPRSMIKLAVVTVLGVGLSFAFADRNPSRDVHVNVDTGPAKAVTHALPIDAVGSTLYKVQQGVHHTVKQTTGTSVDHHYVWIGVDGQSVPVDPFEFSR